MLRREIRHNWWTDGPILLKLDDNVSPQITICWESIKFQGQRSRWHSQHSAVGLYGAFCLIITQERKNIYKVQVWCVFRAVISNFKKIRPRSPRPQKNLQYYFLSSLDDETTARGKWVKSVCDADAGRWCRREETMCHRAAIIKSTAVCHRQLPAAWRFVHSCTRNTHRSNQLILRFLADAVVRLVSF